MSGADFYVNCPNKKQYLIRVYVINLDRSPERWKFVAQQLARANIPYNRFSAIDGKQLSEEQIKSSGLVTPRILPSVFRSRGSLGCYLSHVKIWQENEYRELGDPDALLIFEDDAIIRPNLLSRLPHILGNVPKDWDLLYLGSNTLWGRPTKNRMFMKPFNGNKKGKNAGMWGYMVNTHNIARWMPVMLPIRYPTKDPWIRQNFNKIRAYFLINKLVFQNTKLVSSRGLSKIIR